VAKQYVTIEQANVMLPEVKSILSRMQQMHHYTKAICLRLDELDFIPDDDDFSLTPPEADGEVIHLLSDLRLLLDEMDSQLNQLNDLGCHLKDVERGLVDWYAKIADKEVFLCWQLGEELVAYWHPIESGFKGRRPLEELVELGL